MADIEKVINDTRDAFTVYISEFEGTTNFDANDIQQSMQTALTLLKKQNEVITALLHVGYPHNFQHEPAWIRNYMYDITKVIDKAFEVKDDA